MLESREHAMVFFVGCVHKWEPVKDGTVGTDNPIKLAMSGEAPLVTPNLLWHLINRPPPWKKPKEQKTWTLRCTCECHVCTYCCAHDRVQWDRKWYQIQRKDVPIRTKFVRTNVRASIKVGPSQPPMSFVDAHGHTALCSLVGEKDSKVASGNVMKARETGEEKLGPQILNNSSTHDYRSSKRKTPPMPSVGRATGGAGGARKQ